MELKHQGRDRRGSRRDSINRTFMELKRLLRYQARRKQQYQSNLYGIETWQPREDWARKLSINRTFMELKQLRTITSILKVVLYQSNLYGIETIQ